MGVRYLAFSFSRKPACVDSGKYGFVTSRDNGITSVRNAERGSALVYILIAIALLAALTATFMEPSSQQTSSQNTFKAVSDLKAQIDMIRTSVQECILLYPGGDDTIDTTPGADEEGYNHPFPLDPNSSHFSGATIGASGDHEVRNLRCPGNPGDNQNHELIFTGSSQKFLPPPPDLFEEWEWYNSEDGVFFWTHTTKSDAFLTSALQKLDEQFAPCESDIITASGSDFDMDSNASPLAVCDDGTTCFRVWMKVGGVTATEFQEAGCP